MNSSSHPNSAIKQKITDIIRDSVVRAEKDGKLTKAQVSTIFEQQWYKALAPSVYGGGQTPLPEVVKLVEAISWADGSAGWSVANTVGAGWLSSYFETAVAQKIVEDAKSCITGNGETTGTAEKTENGYTFSGLWKGVSINPETTGIAVHCKLMKDGEVVKDTTINDYVVVSAVLTRDECSISNTYNTIGLGSASLQNVELKNLELSADRVARTVAGGPKVEAPLYKFPFTHVMEALLSSAISGMAIHFVDGCESFIADQKNKSGESLMADRTVVDMFNKQVDLLEDARTKLMYALELSWQTSKNTRQIKPAILYKISAAAYELADVARGVVDTLYPFCGLAATEKSGELNRVWRDIHTASQSRILVIGSLPE